jgi:FMN phosphatase YigB (HAD superfamily)
MELGMMTTMSDRLILTDVDGVLLDWAAGFDAWMLSKGYQHDQEHAYLINERFHGLTYEQSKQLIKEFNESEDIGNLAPLRDAVAGVHILSQAGYKFGVITSHSDVDHACARREQNLRRHFTDVFDFFIHLPTGSDKDHILEQYRGKDYWWIEDKTENAIAGHDRGLRAILVHHEHNRDDQHDGLHRVHRWQDICALVLGAR